MQHNYKRKNYFIKKDFQGKFILSYFLNVVIGSIVFAIILSIFSANTLTIIYDNASLQIGATPVILLKKIIIAHWLLIICGGILIVAGSMLFTHRVAGPIFKFEKALDEMIEGNFSFNVHLRSKDEAKELQEKINDLTNMLSLRLNRIKNLAEEMAIAIDSLSRKAETPQSRELAVADLAKLEELRSELSAIIQTFKLKNI